MAVESATGVRPRAMTPERPVDQPRRSASGMPTELVAHIGSDCVQLPKKTSRELALTADEMRSHGRNLPVHGLSADLATMLNIDAAPDIHIHSDSVSRDGRRQWPDLPPAGSFKGRMGEVLAGKC